jgi:tRNA threonylcarbamoyladenosine biosynthesis protein TsaE
MSRLILLPDEAATLAFGKQIGGRARGGEVVGLIGPLGAGKTVFVRGLAAGLGIEENVIPSPTFVMMNLYTGRLPLCHADLYRLDAPLATIGLNEYLGWEGVTAIEWANKAEGDLFPIRIELAYAENNGRTATVHALPDYAYLGFFE